MTRAPRVLVVNPNSSESVTKAIDRAVQGTAAAKWCRFESVTSPDGPEGIVTQHDYDVAARQVPVSIRDRLHAADAFIVACFSDPGLLATRDLMDKPVVGLGEAGMRAALAAGAKVGVIAVSDAGIPRHTRYWNALGIAHRVAGERAINLRVDQSGDPKLALGRLVEAGRLLRDTDGADVLLLGCAGMADLLAPLQGQLNMTVVEPCGAAAEAAASALHERSGR